MPWQSNQDRSAGPPPMVLLPDVTLTDEEQKEFQDHWRALFPPSTEGHWYMKQEHIEPFQRSQIAFCLIGRAERFALLANSRSDYRAKACEAAAKACAVYPLSAYLYDFATILQQFGRTEEARTLFSEFLRRPEAGPVREVDEVILRNRDIEQMIARARDAVAHS